MKGGRRKEGKREWEEKEKGAKGTDRGGSDGGRIGGREEGEEEKGK